MGESYRVVTEGTIDHEKEEARCLFDKVLKYSNHLGFFSEDINFDTKE